MNKRFYVITAVTAIAVILAFSLFSRTGKRGAARGKSAERGQHTAAQAEKGKKEISYWTCGMHPSVHSGKPGKCPICGMDLIPVYKEEKTPEGSDAGLALTPQGERLAGVKAEKAEYRHLMKEIFTVGRIDYDERRLAYITARISGRIERLFVDFNGAKVKKDDPLVLLYSPGLVSTQEEYILALKALDRAKEGQSTDEIVDAATLVESTKKRLLYWGVSEQQVQELEKARQADVHMVIYSPIGGTVIEKNVLAGDYVRTGDRLYAIADLSRLWVKADVYEYEMSWVRVGQEVEIVSPAYPQEKFIGEITFIDPVLNGKTRSVRIRAELPNSGGRLLPEMFVDVTIRAHLGSVLAIPKDALLDTGRRKIVYVRRDDGRYVGREVEVGPEATAYDEDGQKQRMLPVLKGLDHGEHVVTKANFLIDSQGQISGSAAAAYGGALEMKEGEKMPAGHKH
ncbi:efflux RND transporter periplasmic adaptor subunit [Candidatus Desantisbacteria bacterium CG_4_10_14_0_8_um_filter_48_22]|uniref:Efflux RND transporter periplasmic adaptor subunit n=1 Tax=Candidatus Desantisbacteria bacterium CG_4_10_14_0_8_um_filter_48_22 TaxID=1974543 RepID=A0A2M7S5I0_9BACT|nr:MAG: efflux RND transporter periplasmic adaptor subunit [Candidatus Desantisbacteria bacterium CG02_land_8_20_14_3_00_49_13]PIZ14802.1 MAG: efflux RND transporter periplasmic adaptor subunit [Candidatus Desantisbacteria bacterium CG_4_10_14_0_8_um_filter_48_22]